MVNIEAIVAFDVNKGIAKNGVLPWSMKEDMAFFKEKTVGNIVIMGINTFLSIPTRFRPLKDRLNIVLTSRHAHYNDIYSNNKYKQDNLIFTDDQYIYKHIQSIPEYYCNKYKYLNNNNNSNKLNIYIIGGKQVYTRFLPLCKTIWVSQINGDYCCDLFLDNYAMILDDPLMYNKTIYKEYNMFTIYKYDVLD